jgi:uncharacterized RDD family membrane protein YckC
MAAMEDSVSTDLPQESVEQRKDDPPAPPAEEAPLEDAAAEDATIEDSPNGDALTVGDELAARGEEASDGDAVSDDPAADGDEAPEQASPVPAPAAIILPGPQSSAGRRFGVWVLEVLLLVVTFFVGWFIWSLRTWARGQSPAKSLLGTRCVRVDTGRVAGWGTMFLREFVGKWLLGSLTGGITLLVSGVMILGRSRRGIWDRLAKTVVVDDPDGDLLR